VRALWLALLVAVAIGWPAVAAADKPRVAVVGTDKPITGALRKAIAKQVELVEVDGTPDDAAALAREHRLQAVITVVVSGTRKRTEAEVSVIDGRTGERLGGYATHGKRSIMPKRTAYRAWRKLDTFVDEAQPPEPEEERQVAEEPPEEQPESATEVAAADTGGSAEASAGEVSAKASPRPAGDQPWLELSAQGVSMLRLFRYNDDLNDTLREYDLMAPAVAIGAVWRPASSGVLGHLALHGQAELGVGINGSKTPDGMEYPTSASEWSAGLRVEVPLAGWRWALDASFGEQRFTIDDDAMDELLPDVAYRWARAGLGVRIPVSPRLAVAAGGGFRHLLDTGGLGSDAWFPRLTGAGVDAHLGGVWQLGGPVAVHLRGDLRRYFFAMNPEVGDPHIAGGAIDQYLAIMAGLTVALR
jgi:hypothetical protein